MKTKPSGKLSDGVHSKVIGGVHEGKSGTIRDIKTGKTGFVSITVVQANGVKLKTLAKNVEVQAGRKKGQPNRPTHSACGRTESFNRESL